MIRLTLLTLFISFLCVYAFKDWFKSLCGLILLMAVVEHPDMPKGLFDIPGLSPWNILLLFVLMGWATQRHREGLRWDMPRGTTFLFFLFIVIILIGFSRMIGQREVMLHWIQLRYADSDVRIVLPSTASLISEYLINSLKWLVPGMLLFDGVRDRTRLNWAVVSIVGLYLLLAIQVIKWMPLEAITSGSSLTERSLKILMKEVGYHRVNLAVMLAGAAWAAFAARSIAPTKKLQQAALLTSGVIAFGLALTGGRSGYLTWALVGVVLSLIRWRKYLVIGPLVVALVISFVPAVKERMTQGFSAETRDSNALIHNQQTVQGDEPDAYTITAGRNIAWPYVLDKIGESQWIGFGREAMQSTGLATAIWLDVREDFPHPHNAYLQWTLDNGLLGALPVALLFLIFLSRSMSLFADSSNPAYVAIGGMSLALVLALLFGAFGSQTFYPREGSVGMWCSIALMLRMHVTRQALRTSKPSKVPPDHPLLRLPAAA